MEEPAVEQSIREGIPAFPIRSMVFEGEGDFCRAYTVNGDWIFRFAHNAEGSRTLEREMRLLPRLAAAISLQVPSPEHFGRQSGSGLAFMGYRKIMGVALTKELFSALEPSEQERCARELATFLRELHSFDLDEARRLGVPECDYPFCRTEDGIMRGSAEEIYTRELARLLSYPVLDEDTRLFCKTLVERLLSGDEGNLPPALVHGDLSAEHVLFDAEARRISGMIDFSDAVITTPLIDFVYLYHAYGEEFVRLLLGHYAPGREEKIAAGVQRLHAWYTAVRLLWALDHGWEEGVKMRLAELLTRRVGLTG